MAIMGRVVTRQEAEKLVYYFDQNGNQTVELMSSSEELKDWLGLVAPTVLVREHKHTSLRTGACTD